MKAQRIAIVDGFTRGPDGLPLSSFARFAARLIGEPDLAQLDDGRPVVAGDAPAVLVGDDGTLAPEGAS